MSGVDVIRAIEASQAVLVARIEAVTAEVARVAVQMTTLNGTVRNLCEWRAAIDERFRGQDSGKQSPSEQYERVASAISRRTLVAVGIGAAVAGGLGGAGIVAAVLKLIGT